MQTATFNLAANDYDAQSNGNFDELAVTSVQEGENKTYIFEYRDGEGIRRVPPSVMPSFQAAREEAIRGAIDCSIACNRIQSICQAGWCASGTRKGELLCVIDGQAAEEAQRAGQDSGTLSR